MRMWVVSLLGLGACVRAVFSPTLPGYQEHAAGVLPDVFVDRLPERPYHSVGILEIYNAGTIGDAMKAAQEKGQEVGCNLVVDRAIHRVSSRDVPRVVVVAQTNTPPPPVTISNVNSSPPNVHAFICGVYDG